MISVARRAIASLSDSEPAPQPRIDLKNIYTSAFAATIAIYFGAYASLRVWRALQAYDNAVEAKDQGSRCSSKCARVAFGFVAATFFALEVAFAYAVVTGSVKGTRWGIVTIATLMLWAGFSAPVISVFCDKTVSRILGRRVAFPSIRTIKAHRKRALLIQIPALVLAVCTALRKLNDGVFAVAVAGLIYRLTSKPAIHSRKGWMSVRGAILTVASFAMLWISLTAVLVFLLVRYSRDTAPDNTSSNYLGDVADDFDQLSLITIHFVNVVVGAVIGIVLRYEYSRTSEYLGLPQDESKAVPVVDAELRTVTIPRTNPSFSAPLFHLSLATFFLVHVPSLLLTLPQFQYLYTSTDIPSSTRLVFSIFAEVPPQLWALVAVPSVVAIASKVRGDGHELWTYSEHWIVFSEREALKSIDGAAQPSETDSLLDVKA
ncbi:hypothetical protein BS47DRAFT_1378773 [Hydnum rufescens UP504]|uniref:Uncharacterized protein n=1 Tax=Hydnum rufescens UP504 TaxID=1448309 RepID=A0A9P6BD57_9AGAM|nr:hypothetical protein BS47DRAFT_1378773 [Hydnum rufescens UP504]